VAVLLEEGGDREVTVVLGRRVLLGVAGVHLVVELGLQGGLLGCLLEGSTLLLGGGAVGGFGVLQTFYQLVCSIFFDHFEPLLFFLLYFFLKLVL